MEDHHASASDAAHHHAWPEQPSAVPDGSLRPPDDPSDASGPRPAPRPHVPRVHLPALSPRPVLVQRRGSEPSLSAGSYREQRRFAVRSAAQLDDAAGANDAGDASADAGPASTRDDGAAELSSGAVGPTARAPSEVEADAAPVSTTAEDANDDAFDASTIVTKSSTGSLSRPPSRFQLPRMLTSRFGLQSRIHPVAYAAESADRESADDSTAAEPASSEPAAPLKSSRAVVLDPKPVHVIKPGTLHQPPRTITHSHRSVYVRTQESLKEMFEGTREPSSVRVFHRVSLVAILASILALALETCDGPNHGSADPGYPWLPGAHGYDALDLLFTVIFTVELLARAVYHRFSRRLLKDAATWIDLLAVSPWYIETAFRTARDTGHTMHYVSLLRLLRILRIVIILRGNDSSKILYAAIKASVRPLSITMFFLFTLVMILATAIFYAEPCDNVTTCPFTDIFNSAYFMMVTVATVGYGNQVPSKDNIPALLLSCVAMIFGQLYFAMPLAIVGNNFQDMYEHFQLKTRRKNRPQDTTLSPFDSVKLHRKSQRLCEIQFHFLDAWRVIQLNINKLLRQSRELAARGVTDDVVQAQSVRNAKIKEACDKFMTVHAEACELLQTFVPHKQRRRHSSLSEMPSDSMLSQVYSRARRVIAKARHRSNEVSVSTDPRAVSMTARGRLWLVLECPDSSPLARSINKVMVAFAIMSVITYFSQSLPELRRSGIEVPACEAVVQQYCWDYGVASMDGGCFVRHSNSTADFSRPLEFACTDIEANPECYGAGVNTGSRGEGSLPCDKLFAATGVEYICYRPQCVQTDPLINMEPNWIYIEWFFGIVFSVELVLRFYVSRRRRHFLNDLYNVFDVLAVLPFIFDFVEYVFKGVAPAYAIVANQPSFFSVVRVLKTMRILKLTRGLPPGKRVLIQDREKTIITDMVHSTWLAIVTFTAVGYGDMRPRTPVGRLFTIGVAVLGTIYTAMPITLVGTKFHSLYVKHVERASLRRGGSSASWKTRRNMLRSQRQDETMTRGQDEDEDYLATLIKQAIPFALNEGDLLVVAHFQAMRRTMQNLQRHLSNLSEVGNDMNRRRSAENVAAAAGASSQPAARKTDSIERAIEEKSSAILDTLLQFSSLVAKLQDAPQFFEAIIPEDNPLQDASNPELGGMLSAKLQSRLLR
ncbi:hypothetical protein ATCC90586_008310 [Pythium insidiosum]|nr:hypothetical protein ATCC90586_008310 [Pythium insidiosum]